MDCSSCPIKIDTLCAKDLGVCLKKSINIFQDFRVLNLPKYSFWIFNFVSFNVILRFQKSQLQIET